MIDIAEREPKRTELKEFIDWEKEFRNKFGIEAYTQIMNKMTSLLQANEELRKSRDKWKEKFKKIK